MSRGAPWNTRSRTRCRGAVCSRRPASCGRTPSTLAVAASDGRSHLQPGKRTDRQPRSGPKRSPSGAEHVARHVARQVADVHPSQPEAGSYALLMAQAGSCPVCARDFTPARRPAVLASSARTLQARELRAHPCPRVAPDPRAGRRGRLAARDAARARSYQRLSGALPMMHQYGHSAKVLEQAPGDPPAPPSATRGHRPQAVPSRPGGHDVRCRETHAGHHHRARRPTTPPTPSAFTRPTARASPTRAAPPECSRSCSSRLASTAGDRQRPHRDDHGRKTKPGILIDGKTVADELKCGQGRRQWAQAKQAESTEAAA